MLEILTKYLLRVSFRIVEVFMPKKVPFDLFAHILEGDCFFQEVQQTQQFPIFVEVVVGEYGNAILRLGHQRKPRIVYQNRIL